jgi:hypothetical protein
MIDAVLRFEIAGERMWRSRCSSRRTVLGLRLDFDVGTPARVCGGESVNTDGERPCMRVSEAPAPPHGRPDLRLYQLRTLAKGANRWLPPENRGFYANDTCSA